MDFDLEKDIEIFNDFFKKRPEISKEVLKKDLEKYYLPFIKKLLALRVQKNSNLGIIIGISAIQGAGKTTQGEILEILLNHFDHSTDSLSIDDHYLTHLELCELREEDPRFIRRGVTHDINLAIRDLESLKNFEEGQPILVSGYDKGVQSGDGDRLRWVNLSDGLVIKALVKEKSLTINKKRENVKAIELQSASYQNTEVWLPSNMGSDIPLLPHFIPEELINFLNEQAGEITITLVQDQVQFSGQGEINIDKEKLPNGWKLVTKKPDFIFYDGWMLGARMVADESVFESGLPALDTPEHIDFAKYVNQKLLNYEKLWGLLDFMSVLYVVNYQDSLKWRDQAEEALRQKGEGMSSDQIREFVYYFWRSVHPAIHIKALAEDPVHTNQVVIINDDHSIGEILSPQQVQERYK